MVVQDAHWTREPSWGTKRVWSSVLVCSSNGTSAQGCTRGKAYFSNLHKVGVWPSSYLRLRELDQAQTGAPSDIHPSRRKTRVFWGLGEVVLGGSERDTGRLVPGLTKGKGNETAGFSLPLDPHASCKYLERTWVKIQRVKGPFSLLAARLG